MADQNGLWESEAEARMLETRINGFWNPDYFKNIILPLLNLKAGSRVLDIGSGNGALILLLARNLPDVHFIGVDITPALIEDAKQQAQKLGVQNVEFQEGNALQLPFVDDYFDATVCQTLLMHLPEPAKAVMEMSRVLKQGGKFFAAEFHILNYDKPVISELPVDSLEEEITISRYIQMLNYGYRASGQGDLKMGGRVPFLAIKAGLTILDVRINDRVPHAFPPYGKASEKMALSELQGWETLVKDPAYRSWLIGVMTAAGGTESDVDKLLELLPSHNNRDEFDKRTEFAFIWLLNPVLLITIARKG